MYTHHKANSINDKGWVLLFHVTVAFASLQMVTNAELISLSLLSFQVKFSTFRIQFPITKTINLLSSSKKLCRLDLFYIKLCGHCKKLNSLGE